MNIVKKVLFMPALALCLASCSSDDDKGNTLSMTYGNCFNYVMDRQTGSTYIDDELGYNILYNFDNSTADIDVYGLNLTAGDAAVSVQLHGLPLKASGSAYVVDVPMLTAGGLTFTDFKFTVMDRIVSNQIIGFFSSPVAMVSYNVTKEGTSYAVTTYMRTYVYMDQETVVTGGDAPFTSKNTYYQVTLDPKKLTASIFIDGPRFAEGMPTTLRMTYPNIPMEIIAGGFKLASPSVVPTLPDGDKQVEAPGYKITDLSATANVETGMVLDYKCTMQPKNAPAPVTYTVSTKLGYTIKQK